MPPIIVVASCSEPPQAPHSTLNSSLISSSDAKSCFNIASLPLVFLSKCSFHFQKFTFIQLASIVSFFPYFLSLLFLSCCITSPSSDTHTSLPPHTDVHGDTTGSDLQENKVILEGTTSCSSVLSAAAAAAAAPTTLTLGREEDGMCGAAKMPLPK